MAVPNWNITGETPEPEPKPDEANSGHFADNLRAESPKEELIAGLEEGCTRHRARARSSGHHC